MFRCCNCAMPSSSRATSKLGRGGGMPKLIDLSGQRFGRLTVIERAGTATNRGKQPLWLCECDCGNTTIVGGCSLKSGNTKSCGCLRVDTVKATHTTHGGSKTRLFRCWNNAKTRCYCPSSKDYKEYGARGIRMCDEWLQDFGTFQNWALGNGYSDSLTLDRINPDGNYCPENCRWVDIETQANNKRMCFLTYNGETHTRKEWAEITGISRNNIANRLHKGWTVERTLTEPVRKCGR